MVGIFRRSGIAMPLAAFIAVAGASAVHAEVNDEAVLETYANIVEANYSDALSTAKALEVAIGALVAHPSEEALKSARSAWKAARIPYQQTEAFRFCNPIVDNWEGRVNAWPLDEGLIEQIADSDLAALADPDDRDGDGISGRLIQVSDPKTGEPAVGRYGWKASRHSIHAQSAAAFSNDIGLSTSVFPGHAGDCTRYQADCRAAPHGAQPRHGNTEVPDHVLDLVTDFAAQIAVPARRDVADRQVLRGKELFYGAGCTSCHRPKFVTRRNRGGGGNAFQLIWPYSDFLLHDMGDGLADAGEGKLSREWRTPPLWGIGLTGEVLGARNFLHDGRARTLEKAVLWHDGEAVASRDAFAGMPASNRKALIRFLNSL